MKSGDGIDNDNNSFVDDIWLGLFNDVPAFVIISMIKT